jgi:hypothetical protein
MTHLPVSMAQVPPILFHYTSEDGYRGILTSRQINPSIKAVNPNDARYGDGQYLSDIPPGTKTPEQLSRAFIGMPFQPQRFTHYIAINVKGLNVIKGRDNVFVVPNQKSLDISKILVDHGKNQ